jgi:hypothetical protein
MSEAQMTFKVSRVGDRWCIARVYPGWLSPIGGHYKSRKQALLTARLLAGWAGKVVVA